MKAFEKRAQQLREAIGANEKEKANIRSREASYSVVVQAACISNRIRFLPILPMLDYLLPMCIVEAVMSL